MYVQIAVRIVVLLHIIPEISATHGTYITSASNLQTLLSIYGTDDISTHFLPIYNQTTPLLVTGVLSLYAISDFDEVSGTIDIEASLSLNWYDEIIQSYFGPLYDYTFVFTPTPGITTLLVPSDRIWTPQLVLQSAIGTSSSIGDKTFKCRYDMTDGFVMWNPRISIRSACSANVKFYPYDRQSCELVFVTWGYDSTEIELRVSSEVFDLSSYEESGEWDITETISEVKTVNNQDQFHFTINIKRKPLYFTFNIICPVIVLTLLNGVVFWLPIDAGGRVGFSVTCFLSFVVMLSFIMEILPRTSSPMSYLCYYLLFMMFFSGLTTVTVIFEIFFFFKTDDEQVPAFVKMFLNVLSLKPCRKGKETGQDVDKARMKPEIGRKSSNAERMKMNGKAIPEVHKRDNEKPAEDKTLTWKQVIKTMDKFLFFTILGTEFFFTVCFLGPLFSS